MWTDRSSVFSEVEKITNSTTVQCKAHREIKHGRLGNISSDPSSILFIPISVCCIFVPAEITLMKKLFQLIVLLYQYCIYAEDSKIPHEWEMTNRTTVLDSRSGTQLQQKRQENVWGPNQCLKRSPNGHFQAGHSVLVLKSSEPTLFMWIFLNSRIVELDTWSS